MPLPWKKAKIDRVSRLVADLRSSNHRQSLVVQTGFPTSLFDLFVKNRDRLKKPSRKKQNKINRTSLLSDPTPLPPPPSPLLPPPLNSFNSISSFSVSSPAAPEINEQNFDRAIGKDVFDPLNVVEKVEGDEDELAEESVVPSRRAFVLAVKLFLLLILAFGTKKLALGVTASAFLLLFLEFTSTRLISFLKRCSDARTCLRSLIENIFVSFQREKKKNDLNRLEDECVVIPPNCFSLSEGESAALLDDEIQIIQSELDFRDSAKSCEVVELDEKKRVLLKDEYATEVEIEGILRKTGSTNKLKAKFMKKLIILKKILGSKSKKNKEYEQDRPIIISNCTGGEEKITIREEKEDEREFEDQDEVEEVHEEHRSTDASKLCCKDEAGENVKRKAAWNSGHLIPFMIILAGLLGGRIMALVLIMAWGALTKLTQMQKIRR